LRAIFVVVVAAVVVVPNEDCTGAGTLTRTPRKGRLLLRRLLRRRLPPPKGTPRRDGAPRGKTANGANANAVSVFVVIVAAAAATTTTVMATTEGRSGRGWGGMVTYMGTWHLPPHNDK
jgi:hypothetical protein